MEKKREKIRGLKVREREKIRVWEVRESEREREKIRVWAVKIYREKERLRQEVKKIKRKWEIWIEDGKGRAIRAGS